MQDRNIALLLGGQLVSQVGDKFHMLAVAFLVLETTGSPARMGLVLFCSLFPTMLLGIVAGAVLDRHNIKHIIVAADLIRGLVVAALAVAYSMDQLPFGYLLLAQTLIATCTAFFDPAIPAIIPKLVDRQALTRTNAQTQLVNGIATIAGPALGGLTVAWGGYLPVFLINAGSYLISGAFESRIHLPSDRINTASSADIGRQIQAGCRYIGRRADLVLILGVVAVIHFFVGALETIIPVLADGIAGDGRANMGFIQTSFGLGTVCAALFISVRKMAGAEAGLLFGGVFVIGLLLLALAGLTAWAAGPLIVFLPLFFGVGCAVICAGTSFRSILQRSVASHMLGRVFGVVSSVGNISIPLAALAAGAALTYFATHHLLIICGCGLLVLGPWGHHLYSNGAAIIEGRSDRRARNT